MKKILATVIAFAVVFGLASCNDTTPVTTTTPVVTTTEPVVTTTEPVVTTAEPVVTTTEPVVATTEPVVTTTEPVVTTTEPVVTTTEPVVTTTEPAVTTTEPAVTTTEPVVTITEPVVTTTEPSETTEPVEVPVFDFINENLDEYIVLGKYIGIEVHVDPVPPVSDIEVEEQLASIVDSLPEEAMLKEGVCELGDKVDINFVGMLDGVAFDGGSADNAKATLGAGEYIPGFEEGIVGMAVGETKDITVTFPEDYHAQDLAGKETVFAITLNYIYPELTDENVKEFLGYENVEELKANIRASLEQEASENAHEERSAAAWTKAMANSRIVDCPEVAVAAALEEQKQYYRDTAAYYGMTYEQLMTEGYGVSVEDAEAIFTEYAKNTVSQQLLLYAIARDMKMDLSDEAYATLFKVFAENAGFATIDEFCAASGYSKAYIKELLIYEGVVSEIAKNANFVESAS